MTMTGEDRQFLERIHGDVLAIGRTQAALANLLAVQNGPPLVRESGAGGADPGTSARRGRVARRGGE